MPSLQLRAVFSGPDAVKHAREAFAAGRSRWPHHTASAPSMLGRAWLDSESNAIRLTLGECSLADMSVLVLTDLPEWKSRYYSFADEASHPYQRDTYTP